MQILLGIIIIVVITLLIISMTRGLFKRHETVDELTGALNDYAFEKVIGSVLNNNTSVNILVFIYKSKSVSKEKYGSLYQIMALETAKTFKKIAGRKNVYYLQQGRFAITIPKNIDDIDSFTKKATEKVVKLFNNKNIITTEIMASAVIKLPEEAKTVGDIYQLLRYLEIMPRQDEGKVYTGNDLDSSYLSRFNEIDKAIDRAMEKDSFEIYYQPIYSIKEDRIVAAEALLRMIDDELGFVSPDIFIPIAEETGKIVDIGKIVVKKVCNFLKNNSVDELNLEYMEINLSTIEVLQENFPEDIANILDAFGVPRDRLFLEITEEALSNKQLELQKRINRLNELGFGLTLDDYGTGHSTLTYVMTLPFNDIKIDRTMLWKAMESQRAMYALCASINLLKDIETKIVVEGVETDEMVDTLKSLRCDYLQGFYFAKPMPEAEFVEFLANN